MEEIIKWDNLRRVLGEIANEIRNEYQDKLIRDDKIASGHLLNSVEYDIVTDDRSITVQLELADYYKWVEEGREPGSFPPVDALLEWIKVKPVVPDGRSGRLPTENQLAYLIGRKIKEEGIEPGYELRDTMKEVMEDAEDRINEAIALDISQSLDILFSTYFN